MNAPISCYNETILTSEVTSLKTAYIHAKLRHPHHDAFIVENGQFTVFGKTIHVLKHDYDTVVDLAHHHVLPGFHDSHLHVLGIGMIRGIFSAAGFARIDALIEAARNHPADPLIGRGYHESQFTPSRSLVRTDLDQISTEKPVIIYRVCGHMATANTVALQAAKQLGHPLPADPDSFDLESGIFKEEAIEWLTRIVPHPSHEQLTHELLDAQAYLLSLGVTAVGSDDFAIYKMPFEPVTDAIEALDAAGRLKIRLYEQANLPVLEDLQRFIAKGYPGKRFNRYRIGPLKLLADGSLGARSAYMSQPYQDRNTRGIRVFSPERLATLVQTAMAAGMDFAIHAIGDQMVEELCELAETFPEETRMRHRHSIIHAQLARRDQIDRMQRLNLGAQTQPIFINADLPVLPVALGERMRDSYLFGSMLRAGVLTTIGTDAPVESPSPFENLYVAMTRRSIRHPELGVFLHDEALTFDEAISAYTHLPAYLTYDEARLGRLKAGYRADFIVVKGLIPARPDSLLQTHVLQTYIDGECVYQRPE